MKTKLHHAMIIAGSLLFPTGTAGAQQAQNKRVSEIEDSFVRLMRFSAANASSETPRLHQRILRKAYEQYMAAVGNELKVLRELLDAAGGGPSDARDEISAAIKGWEEKQATDQKDFQKVASSVNSASSASAVSSANASSAITSGSAASPPPAGSSIGASANINPTSGPATVFRSRRLRRFYL